MGFICGGKITVADNDLGLITHCLSQAFQPLEALFHSLSMAKGVWLFFFLIDFSGITD